MALRLEKRPGGSLLQMLIVAGSLKANKCGRLAKRTYTKLSIENQELEASSTTSLVI